MGPKTRGLEVAFHWQGKTHFIGYFVDEKEEARAYDAAILPLGEPRLSELVDFRGPRLHPSRITGPG